jgi:glutamate/tyrosine decarboxylase-like PLP-dependent enzyme
VERPFLDDVLAYANQFLDGLPERRVTPTAGVEELRAALGGALPDDPQSGREVIRALIEGAEPGIMGTPSPRFFGFVIGGAIPETIAADWLVALWDQNAGLHVAGPSASVVEEIAGSWLLDLFGLPASCSIGFVTGGQMANFTCLSVARHKVLRDVGWNVEEQGLRDAPRINVIATEERHVTIDRSLRYLGLGTESVQAVETDEQGRMRVDALRSVLESAEGPTIVCAQAGNVNTGSFDPLGEICDAANEIGSWVHVDGAFGLWAAASPKLRNLVAGIEGADSWASDAHKWLNVPYDCGIAICAHPEAHRAAMSVRASYLVHSGSGNERDSMDWNPEFSRRARSLPTYVALKVLGRSGVSGMIELCCAHAALFAELLGKQDDIQVLNDVVLNQVLVRFLSDDGDHDARTRRVISAVQDDGTCWLGGSTWKGMGVMRISVSNWGTTSDDVHRSVEAILKAAAGV